MAPHGAPPVQGPGCGQPRKPWNKPPDDSRASASRPQRCGVRGRFCIVRSSPNRPGPPPLLGTTYTGQQIVAS